MSNNYSIIIIIFSASLILGCGENAPDEILEIRYSTENTVRLYLELTCAYVSNYNDALSQHAQTHIGRPGAMAINDQYIYIFDQDDLSIKQCSKDMKSIRTILNYGQGPSNISSSITQILSTSEYIIIVDAGNMKILFLDEDGNYLSSTEYLPPSRMSQAISWSESQQSLLWPTRIGMKKDVLLHRLTIQGLKFKMDHYSGRSQYINAMEDMQYTDIIVISDNSVMLIKNYINKIPMRLPTMTVYSLDNRKITHEGLIIQMEMVQSFEAYYYNEIVKRREYDSTRTFGMAIYPIAHVHRIEEEKVLMIYRIPSSMSDGAMPCGLLLENDVITIIRESNEPTINNAATYASKGNEIAIAIYDDNITKIWTYNYQIR